MDEQRKLLDELMGAERNLDLKERENYKPRRKTFSDRDICKSFLCGFCPHEEFRRTKNDMGDCELEHDEKLQEEWEALDDREKERYGFEEDLLRWLERLLSDLRKRISANEERLQADGKVVISGEDQKHLDAMAAQISEALKASEQLGEQGDVDGCQAALNQAEALKRQRAMFEQEALIRGRKDSGSSSRVCQVSGLIINDEESRLKDHHGGRNFNSWRKLHEVHAKLLEARERRRAAGYARGGGAAPRPRSRSRERERERYGGRDRDNRRDDRREERDSYRGSRGRDDRDYRASRDGRDDRSYRGSRGEYYRSGARD
eukprot:scaffold10.g2482.t1